MRIQQTPCCPNFGELRFYKVTKPKDLDAIQTFANDYNMAIVKPILHAPT
jgi:hypothetical protein